MNFYYGVGDLMNCCDAFGDLMNCCDSVGHAVKCSECDPSNHCVFVT